MELATSNQHNQININKSVKNQSYKIPSKILTSTTFNEITVDNVNHQVIKSLKKRRSCSTISSTKHQQQQQQQQQQQEQQNVLLPQKQKTKSQIYVCDLCNLAFTAETKLNRHIKTHQYEKPHKCHQCLEDFNVLENLLLHSSLHNKRPFRCPQCGKIFNRLSSLSGHIKSHFKNEYFSCSTCGDMFHYETHLREHVQLSHPVSDVKRIREEKKVAKKERQLARKSKQLVCQFCGKEFKKNCLLERHERIHRGDRPFKCDQCNAAFVQKHSLVIHQLKHTGEKPYKCDQCPQRFAQRGNLTSHTRNVHKQLKNDGGDGDSDGNDNNGNAFPCPQCTCSFKKLRTLNCHLGRFHARSVNFVTTSNSVNEIINQKISNTSNVECSSQEIGGDNFEYSNVIDQLAQLRRPIIESDIATNQVNLFAEINQNNQLSVNTSKSTSQYVVQSLPPLSPVTNQPALENSTLTLAEYTSDGTINHRNVQQKVINNTRWLICLYCPKKFRRPSDLIRHARVHTKEKPFKCPHDECQRQFATKSTLTVHMRVHDKNPPRYHCTICSKTFCSSQTLDFHYTSAHLGEYKCEFNKCNIILKTPTELKNHMFKIHNTKIEMLAFETNDDDDAAAGGGNSLNKSNIVPKLLNDNDLEIDLSKIPPEMIIQRNDPNGSDQITYEIVLEQSSNDKTYRCDICNMIFKQKYGLKQHLSRHLGLKPFKCLECGRTFSTSFVLNRHRLYHSKMRKFQCNICKLKFLTAEYLKRHEVKHSMERNFMCRYCRKLFKTRANCRQHLQIHISDNKKVEVQQEQEIIEQFTYVPVIQITPTLEQPSQEENSQDSRLSSAPSSLPLPLEDIRPFTPEIMKECDKYPKTITDNFVGSVTNDEIGYISVFNPIFNDQTNDDRQNIILATPNNSQLCFEIDGLLTETIHDDDDDVLAHVNSGVPINVQTVPTTAIAEPTITTQHDEEDTQNVSFAVDDHIHQLSSQSIEQSPENKQNKKLETEKKNKCSMCPKSFKKPIDFRRHMRTHTGERPFPCNQCEKSFTLLCVLKEHKKTHAIPSDKIRLPCHICQKSFGSKYSLNIHFRIHAGQKPYKCQYCTMSFRTTGHRQSHENIHLKKSANSGCSAVLVKSQKFNEEKWTNVLIQNQEIDRDCN